MEISPEVPIGPQTPIRLHHKLPHFVQCLLSKRRQATWSLCPFMVIWARFEVIIGKGVLDIFLKVCTDFIKRCNILVQSVHIQVINFVSSKGFAWNNIIGNIIERNTACFLNVLYQTMIINPSHGSPIRSKHCLIIPLFQRNRGQEVRFYCSIETTRHNVWDRPGNEMLSKQPCCSIARWEQSLDRSAKGPIVLGSRYE